MIPKEILFVVLLFIPLCLFAQDNSNQWIKIETTIQSIEKKSSGGKVKEFAVVSFTTQEGQEIETFVELLRIPFFGSFKSAGDKITINYSKENPAIAETNLGMLLSKYGMYVLILFGVIASTVAIIKSRNKTIKNQIT